MLSIHQVKEGKNILRDLSDKADISTVNKFIKTFQTSDKGISFYDGNGNPVLSIPVMGRQNSQSTNN